jgi:anti-anti-sigma factor
LLLKQEGAPMFSASLSTRECDGEVVVTLRGELDVLDAARVAAALAALAAPGRKITSGLAALVRVRKGARRAGGDVLLAAPQPQVLQVLAVTRLTDVFSVHPSVEATAGSAGSPREAARAAARPVVLPVT